MNTNFKPYLFVFTTVIVAFLSFLGGQCFGEDYYVDLTGEVSIWDLSGTYTDTSLGFPVSYTISQDPRGRLTGSGSVTGTLDGASIDTEYDVRGSVRQSRGVISVRLAIRFQGTATSGAEPTRFSASERISAEVNSSEGTLEGMANVSTRVGRSSTREEVPIAWELPADMDGSCEILFNASTDGRRLAGDGQLALSNGSVYGMDVSGRINERNNEGSFRLRGTGAARGFNVNVTTSTGTDAVKAVSGRGLGQRLEAENLPATSEEPADPTTDSPPYTLVVSTVNGSVQVTPEKATYQEGETVQLIPTPAVGYSFRNWSGDATGKRLVQKVIMDSNKSITANFGTWEAPIGIPTPNFGITETYRMYDNPANRNPELTYTQNTEGGYYTHYVDNTSPNATDTDNPYGSKSMPRLTIPWNLPEGSVVELHGGPYSYGRLSGDQYWTWFTGTGTAEYPIFVRGNTDERPQLVKMSVRVGASYLIIENINLSNSVFVFHHTRVSDHVGVRNCEVHGGPPVYGSAIGVGQSTDVVVYNNYIHDNGDPDYFDENDFHGVTAGERDGKHAARVWIVDNHMHGNGGDSVQINSGNVAVEDLARYIYIGRNIMHEEGENAVDLKQCADVVVSENLMYGFRPTEFAHSGSDGTALVINGDTPKERTWILANEICESSNAIRSEYDAYLAGNVIYNIRTDANGRGGYAILTWPAHNLHIVGNTLYNFDRGISHQGGGEGKAVYVHNNILCLSESGEYHIGLTSAVSSNSLVSHNVFNSSAGQAIINWNGKTGWNLAEFRQATNQGEGCIEADPQFYDQKKNHFELKATSPSVDSGTSASKIFDTFRALYGIDIKKDINSNARPNGSAWDIGAYEYMQ